MALHLPACLALTSLAVARPGKRLRTRTTSGLSSRVCCAANNRDQYGVAASCLEELWRKACEVLAIGESLTPVTLVLAEDNSIVDDDDCSLCLPCNTKFVALACHEERTYNNADGGTAWVSQKSFDAHETDSGAGVKWKNMARMLKKELDNIILLSEEELQPDIGHQYTDPALVPRLLCRLRCGSIHHHVAVLS
ncbi:hypothetical protein ACRRTK_016232 [Alexandromys fortis]